MVRIYNLFKYYLDVLNYSIKILKYEPKTIRESHNFLFRLMPNNYYFYQNNDKKNTICIRHCGVLSNVYVFENNKKYEGPFIVLITTEKRKNVYFSNKYV